MHPLSLAEHEAMSEPSDALWNSSERRRNSSERRRNSSERRWDTYMCISQGVSQEDTHESSLLFSTIVHGVMTVMLLKSVPLE